MRCAVVDHRMTDELQRKLLNYADRVLRLPPHLSLPKPVASHPDMLMFNLEDRLFVSKEYYFSAKEQINRIASVAALDLELTDDSFSSEYPRDVAFNAFTLKNAVIGNMAYVSKAVKSHAEKIKKELVNVNQGYAKCSTVVLENAVISADKGICKAAELLGAEAFEISFGDVVLPGYEYGFLGGASGVYDDTVFFCGDINLHRDGKKILDFCTLNRYKTVSLSDEPLYDVGTILFF